MVNYVYLEHYTKDGDLGISRNVFLSLAQRVLSNIKDIIKSNDKKVFKINDYVSVIIRNNKVFYKFNLFVKDNINTDYIKSSITDYISNNLLMMCEVVPFDITVKVTVEKPENN
ncbi:MAG: hypothetical protein WCR97_01440 [Bacilli bacterium]